MPSNDVNDEVWDRLRRQLETAGRVTLAESLLPKSDHGKVREGFTKAEITKIASFIMDACDGDTPKALAYAKRFEKSSEDRLFGRVVRVAVEKKLNA
ncbi:hypothetical protein [Aquamicrobium soli]|jgi:hypothetical protein|uniref:Uncharacterized protein n=1 Tax=Aquamicrobium soli TaxID=1811518 RepID=A0ABV7KB32_9HYPH